MVIVSEIWQAVFGIDILQPTQVEGEGEKEKKSEREKENENTVTATSGVFMSKRMTMFKEIEM